MYNVSRTNTRDKIIMMIIIVTLSVILAAILSFLIFKGKIKKIELGMGHIWNQHIRIV